MPKQQAMVSTSRKAPPAAPLSGWRSPKYGGRGVYFLCTGPDPNGPMPGERLRVVIYDAAGAVTRRLEQIAGEVIDEGYVDFFEARSRSAYESHSA